MKTAYVKYISSLLLFGLNGIVASFVNLSSYEIVFFRTMLGALLLSVVFFITRKKLTFYKKEKRKSLVYLCASGVCMGVSWMFLYEAYAQIGVSLSTLAYSCGPVIVMMLSPILFKEKFTSLKLFSFAAVFVGMILVNGVTATSGSLWGLFCGIMSAIGYAGMVIFNKKAKDIEGIENSALQLIVSFVVVSIFIAIRQGLYIPVEPTSIAPLLILGLVNTGFGCYLYFSSIGKLPAQSVSIWGYLELLSAIVFSFIFLSEKLEWWQFIGAALIVGGAAVGEIFGSRSLRRKDKNDFPQER